MSAASSRSGQALERRRQLRQERRQERLKQIWRVTVLAGSAGALGWGLLQQGWVVRDPDQIEVLGSRQVSRAQVIREGDLQLPLQLLTLQPKRLAQRLSAGLPVEQVQVNRLMLPLGSRSLWWIERPLPRPNAEPARALRWATSIAWGTG